MGWMVCGNATKAGCSEGAATPIKAEDAWYCKDTAHGTKRGPTAVDVWWQKALKTRLNHDTKGRSLVAQRAEVVGGAEVGAAVAHLAARHQDQPVHKALHIPVLASHMSDLSVALICQLVHIVLHIFCRHMRIAHGPSSPHAPTIRQPVYKRACTLATWHSTGTWQSCSDSQAPSAPPSHLLAWCSEKTTILLYWWASRARESATCHKPSPAMHGPEFIN